MLPILGFKAMNHTGRAARTARDNQLVALLERRGQAIAHFLALHHAIAVRVDLATFRLLVDAEDGASRDVGVNV